MMNKNSNIYIIVYASVLVIVVAAVLAFASLSLKSRQQANVLTEKKGAILISIGQAKQMDKVADKNSYIDEEFGKFIKACLFVDSQGNTTETDSKTALDALENLPEVFTAKSAMPLFVAQKSDSEKIYVIPVYGKGLWGPVWGYIAMNSDCNTVQGAVFDHKGETPGLGAEISLPAFQDQFIGKKIFKDDKFMSITLTKGVGSSEGNPHAVDAISGGTLTSNGVRDMLRVCLSDYTPFFEKTRKADQDKTLTQDGASSPDGTSQQSTVEHDTKTE